MITLKKITAYNLFSKWPKIILRRFREKIKNSRWRMLLFYQRPVVMEDVYGIKFVLYPWDKTPLEKLISRRIYKEELGALEKIIKPGDTVFDVGANVGFISCYLARLVCQVGRVCAFEPVQETFYQLRENLALNRNFNVQAYHLAIFGEKKKITINLFSQTNSGWNSLGKPKFKDLSPIGEEEADAETLDNFCQANKIEKINFLKIDVEGFEKFVLLGAEKMLKDKKIECLSFEISAIPLVGSGVKPREVFDLLGKHGYQSYQFDAERNKFSGPVNDSKEFLKNYYASYHDLTKL